MNNYHDMEDNNKLRELIDNSRSVMKESWYDDETGLSEDQKKILFREMKKFNEYGDALFREEEEDLLVLSKKLEKLTEFAQEFLNSEVDEEFDRVTINRNIKEISKYIDKFKKLAQEVREKEDRMKALYEDIGIIFNRYFDIEDRDEVSFDDDKDEKNEWLRGR